MRRYLCDALRIDLVGPRPGDAALRHERLPQAPSRWYLMGFLASGDASKEQLARDSEEARDEPAEPRAQFFPQREIILTLKARGPAPPRPRPANPVIPSR